MKNLPRRTVKQPPHWKKGESLGSDKRFSHFGQRTSLSLVGSAISFQFYEKETKTQKRLIKITQKSKEEETQKKGYDFSVN